MTPFSLSFEISESFLAIRNCKFSISLFEPVLLGENEVEAAESNELDRIITQNIL